MNRTKTRFLSQTFGTLPALFLALGMAFGSSSQAAGLLTPNDGISPALKIKQHHVDVVIEDGYAITKVEQVFGNPHTNDLEAIYSFPVPDKGTVAEFTVWIDGKPVTGEVLEKQQARQIYETEKQAGRDAGLTEKDSYKTFDISVSPVRAGQDTRIRFVYLQPAHVDTGIGRYVYPLEEGGVDEQKNAFWSGNDVVEEQFSFNLDIRSAYPLDAVRVPDQPQAAITQQGAGEWNVALGANATSTQVINEEEGGAPALAPTTSAAYKLDKDLVVYWRHQEGLPGSVDLVAYKPDVNGRGTFMLTVTPGDDLQKITEGRDWVFVLDISGSMKGKYATLAAGVQSALQQLNPQDRFRIVLFNNQTNELTRGFSNATPENVNYYINALVNVQPGGGTNLYAGIKQGIKSLNSDRTSSIILVTDGVANVGETAQKKFIEMIKQKDVRLFSFMMGNSANKPLLDGLTKASGGFGASVSNSDDISGQILSAISKVSHQALHGVRLDIDGIKTADVTPTEIGSLYRGQQLVMVGHYWGDGMADVMLTGRVSGADKTYRTQFAFPATTVGNPEIERLWAYASIEELQLQIDNFGEDEDSKQAITDLALEYGLVTDHTSMLVVRDEVFESLGIKRSNRDRLSVEQAAQQQRAQSAPVSRRVDQQQPMYPQSRPSLGGGAFDPWTVGLLMISILVGLKRVGLNRIGIDLGYKRQQRTN